MKLEEKKKMRNTFTKLLPNCNKNFDKNSKKKKEINNEKFNKQINAIKKKQIK